MLDFFVLFLKEKEILFGRCKKCKIGFAKWKNMLTFLILTSLKKAIVLLNIKIMLFYK